MAVALLLLLGGTGQALATPVGPAGFTAGTVVEGFEGLSGADPNTAIKGFSGILEVAVSTSFLFGSGALLSDPVPNPGLFNAGPFVHDFAIGGGTQNNWGANGRVRNAGDVPFGSGYLGAFSSSPTPASVEFRFASGQHRVGAFVTGTPGTVTLEVYDASDALLESLTVGTVAVSQWDTNFIGIERAEGIHRAVFISQDFGMDNLMFQAPEPSTALTLLMGLAVLARFPRRVKPA